jgi:4-alpha-glucanotransferase
MEAGIEQLHRLAEAAGIARHWRDVAGQDHTVSDDVLRAVLAALGHDAARGGAAPAMVVGEVGMATALPFACARIEVIDEHGAVRVVDGSEGRIPALAEPGYYRLVGEGFETTLAVAPARCPPAASGRAWGPVVQIPSLCSAQGEAFGHLGLLAQAAEQFGPRGAGFLAISPVHALYPGTGEDFSPYSPSSRLFLNGALGDPALLGLPPLENHAAGELIDWRTAMPDRLAMLRALFNRCSPAERERITALASADAAALQRHALFDALDRVFRPGGADGWRDWPSEFRDPASPAVRRFAQEHAEDVAFHAFVQGLARGSLDHAQAAAKSASMPLGLIADLAVGVRPGGSDAWAIRDAMLDGLTIGAPPDPLGPHGQNWGLTTFSPRGLAERGFAPWIDLLRASLAWSGGVRIDHSYGLARLWVIPEGGTPADGTYLHYPFLDLVRLAMLEAHRAGGVIIAEDLGTAPPGFSQAITDRNLFGMRVLWFERAADHGFIGAHDYPERCVAMTGTHDTTTVAGWWKGTDIDWAHRLGRLPDGIDPGKAQEIRDWDRGLLWSTIGNGAPRPAPDDPDPVVDAAIAHVARTPAQLVAVPMEDLAGIDQQVNLPGTVIQHPNWRRRLPAPVAELCDEDAVRGRIETLNRLVHGSEAGN